MIIQEALAFGRSRLTQASSPSIDARLLLEFVLGKEHPYLVAHSDEALTAEQEQQFHQLIERAAQQEPIPYLTGRAPFFGRLFQVSPAVLIPRPETEQLVEAVIAWVKGRVKPTIVDVGTGSGCIAVSLALALPEATIEAIDISEAALAVARHNAAHHLAAERIHFHHGNLLEPLNFSSSLDNRSATTSPPDVIVANLPYITDAEWTDIPDLVKSFEPTSALRGGALGLDYIHQLLIQAKEILSPKGGIFLEIGWKQGLAVTQLGQSLFPSAQVDLVVDYAGNDRIVAIT